PVAPVGSSGPASASAATPALQVKAPAPAQRPKPSVKPPEGIEPRRRQRLIRERDDLEARLDLHGMTQDRARAALHAFIQRAYATGVRSVLVITGRGYTGDGVLRRY